MKKKLENIKVKAVYSEPKDSKIQREKKEIGGPKVWSPLAMETGKKKAGA